MDWSFRDITPHSQTSSSVRARLQPAVKIVLLVLPFTFSLPAPLGSFPSPCKHRGPDSRAAQSRQIGLLGCCQQQSPAPLRNWGLWDARVKSSSRFFWRVTIFKGQTWGKRSQWQPPSSFSPNCAQQQTNMQLIVTDKRTKDPFGDAALRVTPAPWHPRAHLLQVWPAGDWQAPFSCKYSIRKLETYSRAPLKINVFTRK